MLLIAIFAFLASATHALPQVRALGDPMLCCPPPVWQANLIELSTPKLDVIVFARDANQKKEGMKVSDLDGTTVYSQIFIDYNTNTKYTFNGNGSCTVSAPDTPFEDVCYGGNTTVASNIEFLGSGSVAGMLPYNAFAYDYAGEKMNMALSQVGCIPVMQTVSGDPSKPPTVMVYDNVTPNITDPSLLSIPSACVGNAIVG